MPATTFAETRLQRETLVATGFTSDVFTWGEDRVLKLQFAWRPEAKRQLEFAITRAVHAAGVPAPAAYEMVQIGERHGIVFERLHGPSLVEQVERRPWKLFAAARQLAELHARLHELPAPADLPSQRQQMESYIDGAVDYSAAEKESARRHVARLPASECLCHGDFHPANIILTARGPVMIDWSRGTRGHGLADVARTSVLFESAPLPPDTSLRIRVLMKVARRLLHATYLRRYLTLRPGTMKEIEYWRVPQRMAASAWRAEMRAGVKARCE